MENQKAMLKASVNGFYDLQKTRIQTGLRLVANFKVKIGQESGETETELDADAKMLLANLRVSYKRITDGIADMTPRKFKEDGLISTFSEFSLIQQYHDLIDAEESALKQIKYAVREFPIYTQFLEDICRAPAGALQISRKKDHLVDQTYLDAEGKEQTKKGISFNPFLKTKLIGVLGPSFVKTNGVYRDIYDNYKNRIANMPAHEEKTKAHRNNMAIRYTVKRFLVDLYVAWRKLEGLPVAEEYSKAKLGINHKVA